MRKFDSTCAANICNTTKYRNVLRIAQTTTEPLGKLTTYLLHGLTMIYYMEYSILIGQLPHSKVIYSKITTGKNITQTHPGDCLQSALFACWGNKFFMEAFVRLVSREKWGRGLKCRGIRVLLIRFFFINQGYAFVVCLGCVHHVYTYGVCGGGSWRCRTFLR